MAQITPKQCHTCFPSILVRGRATQIAQKSRTCIGLHWGSPCQHKVPSTQDRGKQVRHRDVDIQVDLLHTGMKVSIKKIPWCWFYRIGLMVTKWKLYDSGRPWCLVWLNRLQVKTGRPPCTGGPLIAVAVNAEARRKSDTCNKGQELRGKGLHGV